MEEILRIVADGRACRNDAAIKNRQPVAKLYVSAEQGLEEYFTAIVREELNVKEVVFTDDVSAFTSYTFKPQMRTVGPKYGKLLGGIKQALAEVDGNAAMAELEETGELALTVAGQDVRLTKDDLLIDTASAPGFTAVSEGGVTVVLDGNLTPELIEEGYLREIVSKVQTMRT